MISGRVEGRRRRALSQSSVIGGHCRSTRKAIVITLSSDAAAKLEAPLSKPARWTKRGAGGNRGCLLLELPGELQNHLANSGCDPI